MGACVEENDRIVWNLGFQVFGHAADINKTSRRIVVTVFLHRKTAVTHDRDVVSPRGCGHPNWFRARVKLGEKSRENS